MHVDPMKTIEHILSLPINDSTIDFALVCAAIIATRIALSFAFSHLNK
jgi:hypothetical protein